MAAILFVGVWGGGGVGGGGCVGVGVVGGGRWVEMARHPSNI